MTLEPPAPFSAPGFHGRRSAKIIGGETGAGGILTSQPFATGGGLRGQNSAGRALQGGPVNLEHVSTSDIGACAVVPGERGDLHLARAQVMRGAMPWWNSAQVVPQWKGPHGSTVARRSH